ncbi:unnamed protein product [Gordionus sp. m RMFG-2023]
MAMLNESFLQGLDVNRTILSDINTKLREEHLRGTFARYLNVIITMGIFGNVVLLLLIWKMDSKNFIERRSRFYFLVLAISGILLLLVILPWIIYEARDLDRMITVASTIWFTHFERFLENFLVGFTNYHLALMSLDRMIAISHPFYYRSHFKLKQIKRYVLGFSIFCLVLTIPYLIYFKISRIIVIGEERNVTKNIINLLNFTNDNQNETFSLVRYIGFQGMAKIKYKTTIAQYLIKFSMVYDKIEGVLTDLLPYLILTVCNGITICVFLRRSRLRINKINNSLLTIGSNERHVNPIISIEISIDLRDSNKGYSQFQFDNHLNAYKNKVHLILPDINIANRISLPAIRLPKFYKEDFSSGVGNLNNPKIKSRSSVNPSRSSIKSIITNRYNTSNYFKIIGSPKLEAIRVRNKDLTILTICLSIMSTIFLLPWIIFLFVKSPSWQNEFLIGSTPWQLRIYMLLYSQYFLTPYVIILTSANYRKPLFKMINKCFS